MSAPISIRSFLLSARNHLETALRQKQHINFVIGNESADLDSITSTLLYAFFRSSSSNAPTAATSRSVVSSSDSRVSTFSKFYVPVLNIPSQDISIRPELLALLPHVGLEPSQLITLSDIPSPPYTKDLPAENTSWTLVDHNALRGSLGEAYRERVVGCIDHHEDEHKVPSEEEQRKGEPRIVEVTGSCTSLVINHFQSTWDAHDSSKATTSFGKTSEDNTSENQDINAQLAKLALASILVDTSNLQNADKTTDHDRRAVVYLEKKIADESFDRKAWFKMLQTAKKDLDELRIGDVLRKDYKEWNEAGRRLGVSSVVKPLQWLNDKAMTESSDGDRKDLFRVALKEFAEQRDLAIYAIMTTSSKDGEFRRELLLWVRDQSAIGMMQKFTQLASDRLGLEKWQEGDGAVIQLSEEDESFKIWQQKKVENSRKQVAPLLREAVASL